jgi:RimJ/RimL family protein N-acetyltransferase
MMNFSSLKGQYVKLTAVDLEQDAGPFAKWRSDAEYLRLLDSAPAVMYTEKQVKDYWEKHIDEYLELAIRSLQDNRLIGFIGLTDINWPMGDAWVGIGLGKREDWGRGYGTDAMRVMLEYAFMQLNLHRLSLQVFEYNQRAIRSYEKAGFKIEGRLRKVINRNGRRWDIVYMGILRGELQINGKVSASSNSTL